MSSIRNPRQQRQVLFDNVNRMLSKLSKVMGDDHAEYLKLVSSAKSYLAIADSTQDYTDYFTYYEALEVYVQDVYFQYGNILLVELKKCMGAEAAVPARLSERFTALIEDAKSRRDFTDFYAFVETLPQILTEKVEAKIAIGKKILAELKNHLSFGEHTRYVTQFQLLTEEAAEVKLDYTDCYIFIDELQNTLNRRIDIFTGAQQESLTNAKKIDASRGEMEADQQKEKQKLMRDYVEEIRLAQAHYDELANLNPEARKDYLDKSSALAISVSGENPEVMRPTQKKLEAIKKVNAELARDIKKIKSANATSSQPEEQKQNSSEEKSSSDIATTTILAELAGKCLVAAKLCKEIAAGAICVQAQKKYMKKHLELLNKQYALSHLSSDQAELEIKKIDDLISKLNVAKRSVQKLQEDFNYQQELANAYSVAISLYEELAPLQSKPNPTLEKNYLTLLTLQSLQKNFTTMQLSTEIRRINDVIIYLREIIKQVTDERDQQRGLSAFQVIAPKPATTARPGMFRSNSASTAPKAQNARLPKGPVKLTRNGSW